MNRYDVIFTSELERKTETVTLDANSIKEAEIVCHTPGSGFMPRWVANLIFMYPQNPPYNFVVKRIKKA